jgi:hypothetical protein
MFLKRKLVGVAVAALVCTGLTLGGTAKVHAGDLTTELQGMVADLSTEQQAALLLLITQLRGGAAGGDAAAPAATAEQTPKEALQTNMDKLLKAAKDSDLDGIMAGVSDDFDYYQVGDKEALRGFIQGAMDAGYIEMYIDDVEVNIADAEIEQKGDEYTIYPIEITGPFGSITVEVVAVKKDGEYKVKTLDIYGI